MKKNKRAGRPHPKDGKEEEDGDVEHLPRPCGMPEYHQGGWVCLGCGLPPWHCEVERCVCARA